MAEDTKFSFVDMEGQDLGYRFFRRFEDRIVSFTVGIPKKSISMVQQEWKYTYSPGCSGSDTKTICRSTCQVNSDWYSTRMLRVRRRTERRMMLKI